MPELRQNLITRDWVIIASERANRPNEFKRTTERVSLPQYQPDCPFCPGNEHLTGKELGRIGSSERWTVRAMPNKFPALSSEGERVRKARGIFRSMSGVGIHEVIVEHPRHDLTIALLSDAEVTNILQMYCMRYREIRHDQRVEAIVIFKNHGASAGTSLYHPHSQIAATPVVPSQIRTRIDEAIRYFDDHGECLFCCTLREELASGDRIIEEGDHFVAFQPYAALSPFHTWIFPRRHMSSFDDISDDETPDLARILRRMLARFYYGLNDPDYNYIIRSVPTDSKRTDYFHWYLTIVPRVTRTAGFELGSGMFINTALPEESAKFLRGIKIPK